MKLIKLIPTLLIIIISIPIGVFIGLKYECLFIMGYLYSSIEDLIKVFIDEYLWKKKYKSKVND